MTLSVYKSDGSSNKKVDSLRYCVVVLVNHIIICHLFSFILRANRQYSPVRGKRIHWPGGRQGPPPDEPRCGFLGNSPKCQWQGHGNHFTDLFMFLFLCSPTKITFHSKAKDYAKHHQKQWQLVWFPTKRKTLTKFWPLFVPFKKSEPSHWLFFFFLLLHCARTSTMNCHRPHNSGKKCCNRGNVPLWHICVHGIRRVRRSRCVSNVQVCTLYSSWIIRLFHGVYCRKINAITRHCRLASIHIFSTSFSFFPIIFCDRQMKLNNELNNMSWRVRPDEVLLEVGRLFGSRMGLQKLNFEVNWITEKKKYLKNEFE